MRKRVFFDSSVIVAALLSREGGSYHILSQFPDTFEFQINEYVFEEVRRLIERKFKDQPELLSNLFSIMGLSGIMTLQNPNPQEVNEAKNFISEKDASILASAIKVSDYLLTLDNEFFGSTITEIAKTNNLAILKPGDFIRHFDF
jgi:predicted nucleic acid-binding protein